MLNSRTMGWFNSDIKLLMAIMILIIITNSSVHDWCHTRNSECKIFFLTIAIKENFSLKELLHYGMHFLLTLNLHLTPVAWRIFRTDYFYKYEARNSSNTAHYNEKNEKRGHLTGHQTRGLGSEELVPKDTTTSSNVHQLR